MISGIIFSHMSNGGSNNRPHEAHVKIWGDSYFYLIKGTLCSPSLRTTGL